MHKARVFWNPKVSGSMSWSMGWKGSHDALVSLRAQMLRISSDFSFATAAWIILCDSAQGGAAGQPEFAIAFEENQGVSAARNAG